MTSSSENQMQQACQTASLHLRRAIQAVVKAKTLGLETVDIDAQAATLMSAKLALSRGLLSAEIECHGQQPPSGMCALLAGRVLRDSESDAS